MELENCQVPTDESCMEWERATENTRISRPTMNKNQAFSELILSFRSSLFRRTLSVPMK